MFERRDDRARRAWCRCFLCKMRVQFLKLPHFTTSSPKEVAVPGVAKVHERDLLEAAFCIEVCCEFVRQTIFLYESMLASRSNGLLVQTHCVQTLALKAGYFRFRPTHGVLPGVLQEFRATHAARPQMHYHSAPST